MTGRELDAAGITDAALRRDYELCRRLNARHGKTYFLATRLLTTERRPAVHALYGFARWADEIVDDLHSTADRTQRERALDRLAREVDTALGGGSAAQPVVRALADTAARYAIPARHFADFLAAMRSDLDVTDYPDYTALRSYIHGSAAVIGLQMLPVLGTVAPREEAAPHAAALGVAFQLTNFLRDVGEDLDRGRVYLPADLLRAHGVDRELLQWCRRTGARDRRVRAAIAAGADLTRGVYRLAAPGIEMLDPVSRPCVRTAFILYGDILRAIAADRYDVLHRRSAVSRRRRIAVAADGLRHLAAARLRHRGGAGGPAAEGSLARTDTRRAA
ncbi:phytoene/squalene synthase family protein [Phaeacidiphilus oryzae]|uniref:phytoene/squalene synthase family protein n=1 Tax=Phaeacidiphilus oryzae TaxID=348818 RepID=UPI00056D252D|nr:phytoene/squalene synthase family protein [Phaeacidiphilus oryzae]